MNNSIRCSDCKCLFRPNPRVKNQRYCSRQACQRARKALWQREKMKSDPDYQDNQRRCRKEWAEGHPQYWREYRRTHTQYVLRNRLLQKGRDRLRLLAKMDTSVPVSVVKPGGYYLIPDGRDLAKMDALKQKILLIPMPCKGLAKKDVIAFSAHPG
jgi:hypothetical protein